MSYKPDESTLIAYLYGELGQEEKEKVQHYINENPEALKAMQQHRDVLSILGKLDDKEVIAPPILAEHEPRHMSFWHHGPFKTILGIAASLLLIMVAGKFMGTDVQYSNGELRISFGGVKQTEQVTSVATAQFSKDEVQHMIDASLMKNNQSLTADLSASQVKLDNTVRELMGQNSKKINALVSQVSAASQNQVRDYVSSIQSENLRLMKDYMTLSATEQKDYMENLLVDFAGYLQKQHEQDLKLFQARINNVEQNTDQFKLETEQILASIISNKTSSSKSN